MQRFETEVGSVNTHDNPIEHTHEPILAEPATTIRADTDPSTYVLLLTFASLRSGLERLASDRAPDDFWCQPFSARKALTMTTTSIPSCSRAPYTGGR